MIRAIRCLLILVLSLPMAGVLYAAPKPDPDFDRLQARIAALDSDPALADLAGLERLKARQALALLQTAHSRDRDQALYLAQHRVDAADAAAHAELLQQQSAQLDRERDQIMIQASRIAAEQARKDVGLIDLVRAIAGE